MISHRHTRFASCLIVLALLLWPGTVAADSGNGISSPPDGAVVHGPVTVAGVADGPEFQKWQLDLLAEGHAAQASYLDHGEGAHSQPDAFTVLDSTRFPDGRYTLRLRVVRRDGNYDEHFSHIVIANRAPQPAVAGSESRSGLKNTNRNGLPRWTAEGAPILYLTFDDGPNPRLTSEILAVLERYDARATFFVVGGLARRFPQVLRAQLEAGHLLANHGLDHKSLRGLDRTAFDRQVLGVEQIVAAAAGDAQTIGAGHRYLRLPYAHSDENTDAWAAALGYAIVGWDVDPRDWKRPGAEAIASAVVKRAHPGAIVLLHDGGGGSSQTVAALETILQKLAALGYQFHTLDGEPAPSSARVPRGH